MGRQPSARLPHLARYAISSGTQKLQVLRINFVFIHKKYYWPWLVQKCGCNWRIECFGTLNRQAFTKRLPRPWCRPCKFWTGLKRTRLLKFWFICYVDAVISAFSFVFHFFTWYKKLGFLCSLVKTWIWSPNFSCYIFLSLSSRVSRNTFFRLLQQNPGFL